MNEDLSEKIAQVIGIAKAIVASKIDLIQGCRQINELRWDLDNDGLDERFEYFVRFEIMCYEIPPKDSRHLWSASALMKYDAQEEQLLSEYRKIFLNECRRLIESYENAA